MGEEKQLSEPAEDSSFDSATATSQVEQPLDGVSIFSLSGGIMKPTSKTANRIDGLLARMLLQPMTGKYLADVDKNLDYLFTSLQLDMINMVAEISAEEQAEEPERALSPEPDAKLLLGSPFHDDSRES